MQYLLSEEEMTAHRERNMLFAKLPQRTIADHIAGLVNVCQHVACTMIAADRDGVTPHGCIHVPDDRGPQWQTHYCDHCPVSGICPQTKEWSK